MTKGLDPHPSSLPTTLSRSYKLLGIETDAFVQLFQDRIVLGISQRQQKIGTWCYASAAQSAVDPRAIDWDISNVLGDRNDVLLGVYARQITEQLIATKLFSGDGLHSNRIAVLLGATLQDGGKDPEMFRVVVEVLVQLIRDALAQQNQ